MRPFFLLLAIATASCAPSTGPFTWLPPQGDVRALTGKYPRAVAVILQRDDRLVFTLDRSAPATQQQRHDVIAILAEGGDRFANVSIPVGDGRLSFLRARTIGPDGRIEEVKPEEVHTGVAHTGNSVDGVEMEVKVFRLPGARVGSVIEYAYGIDNDRQLLYERHRMSADIPIVHYHAEIAATGDIELGFRVYNAHPTLDKEVHYATQIAKIDQREIPATRPEPFAPPPTVTEPHWVVIVTKMLQHHRYLGVFDTWSHGLSGLSHLLYETKAKEFPTSELKPNLAGCLPGPRCAVERALALVNAKTELSGFGSSNSGALRPLKEILASGLANNLEKAMMLRRALEAAGVKASFVLLARGLESDFDPGFPTSDRFDHIIVRVDQQPGIDAAVLIDPSCEACEVGQLPVWSNDRQAMILGRLKETSPSVQAETPIDIVRVAENQAIASVHRQLIDATIDPTGAISGRITDELRGANAVDFRIRTRSWLDDRWRQELEDDLHVRAKTAALRKTTPPAWEKLDSRLSFSVDFSVPSYLAADGEQKIVPLSFLRMSWDRDFGDEPRRHDVMLRDAEREEETIVFHLPPGWTATDLPRSSAWHSEAIDGAIDVKSGPGTVTIRRIVQTRIGHWGPGEFDEMSTVARKIAGIRQAAFAVTPGNK